MNINRLIKNVRKSSRFGLLQTIRADLIFGLKNPKSIIFKRKFLEHIKNQAKDTGKNTFFVIAIPGSIHIVELCLSFVPENVPVTIIANGLTTWESQWINDHLRFSQIIHIPSILSHGDVINALVKSVQYPFGILDYDCFVFNPGLFDKAVKIKDNHQLNAFFSSTNPITYLELPATFFLMINAPLYRELIQKYKIDCRHISFFQLSRTVRQRLKSIGIDSNHLPEDFKNYFDTLRLLMVLGLADGYPINYVERFPAKFKASSEIFHVGGISDPNKHKHLWGVRGSYFWRLALINHPDEDLRNNYEQLFGKISPDEVLDSFPGARERIGEDFFAFARGLIGKGPMHDVLTIGDYSAIIGSEKWIINP